VTRFYSLMIERDLFGRVVLVQNCGRSGTSGCELVEGLPVRSRQGRRSRRWHRRSGGGATGICKFHGSRRYVTGFGHG
jgi:hypothetical protein